MPALTDMFGMSSGVLSELQVVFMQRHQRLPLRWASNPRGSNLRMIALMSTVALAAVLPLAVATAGPAGPERPAGPGEAGSTPKRRGAAPSRFPAPSPAASARADAKAGERAAGPRGDAGSLLQDLGLTGTTRCGPELTSPEGLEAQTCVLSEGRDSWARTYYRNGTGRALRAVLTLMRPDGRTVQVHCTVEAEDDPGACETPRAPKGAAAARGARSSASGSSSESAGASRVSEMYDAVAEIASEDSQRLLLRSGSN
ncbi:hypothetical protein [Streptomyces sp. KR80]|uniref:hypothetical protein n=1 Tax=Streptomyces sp. KR80 TaxID=3457426 RepID=UPI003FD5F9BE